MNIKERITDSEILWKNQRFEGAFLMILCAVAAIAEVRYPALKDREKFEKFLRESTQIKLGIEYKGQLTSIETIFYKFMRCKLVHEGGLPQDIKLVIEHGENARHIRAGGAPDYVLHIGYGWFEFLKQAVTKAPEYT